MARDSFFTERRNARDFLFYQNDSGIKNMMRQMPRIMQDVKNDRISDQEYDLFLRNQQVLQLMISYCTDRVLELEVLIQSTKMFTAMGGVGQYMMKAYDLNTKFTSQLNNWRLASTCLYNALAFSIQGAPWQNVKEALAPIRAIKNFRTDEF